MSTEEDVVRIMKDRDDAYAVLGLPRSCTTAEVKAKYKRLALQLHPDKNPSPTAAEAFKVVVRAYDALKTDEQRLKYDRGGFDLSNGEGQGSPSVTQILFVMMLYLLKKRLPAGSSVPEVGAFHSSLYKHLVYTVSGGCIGLIVLMLVLHSGSAGGYRGPDCAFVQRSGRYEPVVATVHDRDVRMWSQAGGCTEQAMKALLSSYNETVCAAERLATASSLLRKRNKTTTVPWDAWTSFRSGRVQANVTREFVERATVLDGSQVVRTSFFCRVLSQR